MKLKSLKGFFSLQLLIIVTLLFTSVGGAQSGTEVQKDFFEFRANNLILLGGGMSTPNIDFPEPEFDFYFMVGYERHIFPHLAIGFSYHKFNLSTTEKFNEGFMSFDINTKYIILPYSRITPFISLGGGYNASNYFIDKSFKAQGGGGFEIILAPRFGLRLFADYNYLFSDDIEGFEFGESNDTFIRIGVGLNIYLGNSHENRLKGKKTIINSNPIEYK